MCDSAAQNVSPEARSPHQPAPRMAVCYPHSVLANVLPCWSAPMGGCPELTWDTPVGQAFTMLLGSLRGLKAGDMDDSEVINEKRGSMAYPGSGEFEGEIQSPGNLYREKNLKT